MVEVIKTNKQRSVIIKESSNLEIINLKYFKMILSR